jgi:hypothetical protein
MYTHFLRLYKDKPLGIVFGVQGPAAAKPQRQESVRSGSTVPAATNTCAQCILGKSWRH